MNTLMISIKIILIVLVLFVRNSYLEKRVYVKTELWYH